MSTLLNKSWLQNHQVFILEKITNSFFRYNSLKKQTKFSIKLWLKYKTISKTLATPLISSFITYDATCETFTQKQKWLWIRYKPLTGARSYFSHRRVSQHKEKCFTPGFTPRYHTLETPYPVVISSTSSPGTRGNVSLFNVVWTQKFFIKNKRNKLKFHL